MVEEFEEHRSLSIVKREVHRKCSNIRDYQTLSQTLSQTSDFVESFRPTRVELLDTTFRP